MSEPCDTCELLPRDVLQLRIDIHGGTWCCPACATIYAATHLVE